MEPLFIYLLKSSGLIALFFISYHILLRKETFFTSNRWFLLSGLATAVVLPLLVYTKVVWVEPIATTIDLSTIPVVTAIEQKTFLDYVPLIMASIYGIGMLVLAIKFLYDFYSLRRLLKGKSMHFQADYRWVDTKENLAPFSFFKTIVYNSALYSPTELENILEHEKVHSDQNHTLDVLIARVFCIVFWFNPFVWFYKKAVLQNLEFIADSEALKKISDKKAYQITLLKITTQENCVAITNHFYQSLIKKRIVMLNQNQSNKRNSWKYFTVLPALIAFMFLFQIETVAQEKVKGTEKISISSDQKLALHITASSTEKDIEREADFFKKEFNIDIIYSNLEFDSNAKITGIKIILKDANGIVKEYFVSGEKAIKPFSIFVEKTKDGKLNFGFSTASKNELDQHLNLVKTKEEAHQENFEIKKETNFWTINNFKKDGLQYLVIVNGKTQDENEKIKIPLEQEIITVNQIEADAAIAKYGSLGKNGAVEIKTGIQTNIKKLTTTSGTKSSSDENESKTPKQESKTISIWTNNTSTSNNSQLTTSVRNSTQIGQNKIDPTNLNGNKVTQTTRTITIEQTEKDGIPGNASYFIDGIKVSKEEVDKISPNLMERMDVTKSTASGTVTKITTKKKLDDKSQAAEDLKQAKKDRAQAIQDRKQALEDRKQAIQDRKQAIEDRKQALDDQNNN